MEQYGAFLEEFVKPWYESLKDPLAAQQAVLQGLLRSYSKTAYGVKFGASDVKRIEDFQGRFPVVTYSDLRPWLDRVMDGDYSSLLDEPVVRWVMTRGTTGNSKLIPATETHLSQILAIGARGIINFALRRKDFEMLKGEVLNLNFPSEVRSEQTAAGKIDFGYSSGTYAKFYPELGQARLVPRQEEIDALGGGISNRDWEHRFELAYQKARDRPIKSLMGVTPVLTSFAKYVKKKHGAFPKEFWKLKAIFCTSVAKIQTEYAPYIAHLYGQVPVVELYTATEGIFAQQLDDNPYVTPNYDAYFFEVKTSSGIKMLHDLKRGEWGRLIISSPLFPRYCIGDLIESAGKGYFRVFGRDKPLVVLEHIVFNTFTGRIFRA